MDITTDLETINYYLGLKSIVKQFIEVMNQQDVLGPDIWAAMEALKQEAERALSHDRQQ